MDEYDIQHPQQPLGDGRQEQAGEVKDVDYEKVDEQ